MILVIIFTFELLLSLFINWLTDEEGLGYFVMMFISCGSISVSYTHLDVYKRQGNMFSIQEQNIVLAKRQWEHLKRN